MAEDRVVNSFFYKMILVFSNSKEREDKSIPFSYREILAVVCIKVNIDTSIPHSKSWF